LARQHLLLVDGDPESLRLTEISLKKAGFSVTAAANGRDAIEKCLISPPDLVVSETRMPEMDGFELCQRMREDDRFRAIPFVFLTGQKSVEDKVRGLELGVEDYLTKPIYVKEIVTRVRMLLQRRERERLERKEGRAGFNGALSEMGIVDLVQTLELGRKSAALRVAGPGGRQATVWFRDGRIVDCQAGGLSGEAAFFRMLHWSEGDFAVEFGAVEREPSIAASTRALLLEGMRRLDEFGRLAEQMPPPASVLEVDGEALSRRLGEIPDDLNPVLRLFDGRRTLEQVVDASGRDDLGAAAVVSRLYFEGIIREAGPRSRPAAAGAPDAVGGTPDMSDAGPGPTPEPAGAEWFAGPADGEAGPAAQAPRPPPAPDSIPAAPAPPPPAPTSPGAPARAAPGLASPVPPPASGDAAPQATRPASPRAARSGARNPPVRVHSANRPAPPRAPRARLAILLLALVASAVGAGWLTLRRQPAAEPPPVPGGAATPAIEAAAAVPETTPATPPSEPASPAPSTGAVAPEPVAATPPTEVARPLPEAARADDAPPIGPAAPATRDDEAAYRAAMEAGQQRYRARAYPAAAAEYQRAVDLRETGEALAALGRALYDGRRTGEARQALRRAVALDPSSAAAWLALGEVHLALREPADARAAYERYLDLEPRGRYADDVRQVLARLGAR